MDRLETRLRKLKVEARFNREIKWSELSPERESFFLRFVDEFFDQFNRTNLRFRQIFSDRQYVPVLAPDAPPLTPLDVQFRICYQFLKLSFGLADFPNVPGERQKIIIRLDNHSSSKHKRTLRGFVENLPNHFNRPDLDITLGHVCSTSLVRIQAIDVLMGAAGNYGNKMHLRRPNGQRGMTPIQKARMNVAKHIYNKFREIDNTTRGSRAFNWFESTGSCDSTRSALLQKLSIWKFHTKNYDIDKGWQNDRLDSQGIYQGPDIQKVKTAAESEWL